MASGFNPADIQKYLEGVTWPIGKDDLVNVLKQNNAPDGVVNKVQDTDVSQFMNQGDLLSKIGL
jgi:hypothetical protein